MSRSRKAKQKAKATASRSGSPSGGAGTAAAPAPATPKITGRRAMYFRLAAISLPFVLLAMLEVFFRVFPGLYEDRDPYVNISPMSVFSHTNVGGEDYYSITHPSIMGGASVVFPVKKPANTMRIFCVGSSACAGWPHAREQTFSAYLQQALENAFPGKKFEVINAAAHGFAAYRTRRVFDEVVKMQPDAVLVWEGNNEFLEERNYDAPQTVFLSLARHLRTFQWLETMMPSRTKMSGGELKDAATIFFKKSRAEPVPMREDPVQYEQVQAHFRESFEHMVTEGQRYHVPVILCTCPVNLHDWYPTVSKNRLTGDALKEWEKLYYHARGCLDAGKIQEGIQTMNQAIAMEKEHAESYFWLGRLLEADGQRDAAWQAYSMARDKDYNPFRAISAFNDTVKELAKKNQNAGVYLVDLDQIFKASSKMAAPGFDLFLDYVHPTKNANLIVAENVYNFILQTGWLTDKPVVDRFTYHELPYGPHGEPYVESADLDLQVEEINLATVNRQIPTIVTKSAHLMEEKLGRAPTGPDDPEFSQVPTEFAERYRVCWNLEDIQRRLTRGGKR